MLFYYKTEVFYTFQVFFIKLKKIMDISLHMSVPVANLTYSLRFTGENHQTVLPTLTQIDKLFN